MLSSRPSAILLAAALCGCAQAQIGFEGYHLYPSLRNFTALPGSGFGVSPSGKVDFRGAMAYGTPVAYTPGNWQFVMGGTDVADGFHLTFSDSNGTSRFGNGTGQFVLGIPIGNFGNLSYGVAVLSSKLDNVGSAQFTPRQSGPVQFAVGILDVAGTGGASGQDGVGDKDKSDSPYVVGTWQACEDAYISLGYGSKRFGGIFGNASYNLTPRFKAIVEYDTFVWTPLVAYDLGKVFQVSGDRTVSGTVTLGAQDGRYGFWGLNLSVPLGR